MKKIVSAVLVCALLCQAAFALAGAGEGWICPKCETSNAGKFCTECGEKKPGACPSCQTPLPGGSNFKFCPSCGASLAGSQEAPAAAPRAAAPAAAVPAADPIAYTVPIDLMQLHQDSYVNTLYLTKESYPEIILQPGYININIESNAGEGFQCVHLPCPDNATPMRFTGSSCSFVAEAEQTRYHDEIHDRYAYEDFNAKVSDDMIIKDGSDGIAIQVIPQHRTAKQAERYPEFHPLGGDLFLKAHAASAEQWHGGHQQSPFY